MDMVKKSYPLLKIFADLPEEDLDYSRSKQPQSPSSPTILFNRFQNINIFSYDTTVAHYIDCYKSSDPNHPINHTFSSCAHQPNNDNK